MTLDSPHLETDPQTALRERERRSSQVHRRVVPRVRAIGFVILGLMAAGHSRVTTGEALTREVVLWIAFACAYQAVSATVLSLWHRSSRRVHLGRLFLRADFLLLGGIIWATGGPSSWLFFIPYVRIAEQASSGWRWGRELLFLALASHLSAIAAYQVTTGTQVAWIPVVGAATLCTVTSAYVVATSMIGDAKHERDRATVRVARNVISDLKANARELEIARVQAEDAVVTKGMFLATMTHELRTPLNAVIGMTDLALGTELDSTQREYLQTSKESALGLLDMINEILDFSKIESGHMEIAFEPFSLRKCFGQALRITSVRADAKDVTVVCDVDPQVPDRVIGDDVRLRQMLVNLLGNAVKFTEEGHVRLSVRPTARGTSLEIVVEDSGIGIEEDKLPKIFDAFTQAEQSTTRRFGGTGLGLSITKALALEMGGEIHATSRVGVGSRFTIRLPIVPAEDDAQPIDAHRLSSEARRGTILVVSPNRLIRESVAGLVASWSGNVRGFESAEMAAAAELDSDCIAVVCDARIEPEDRLRLDDGLGDEPIPWLMLQRATAVRGGGIDEGRTTTLMLPVVGPELKEAIETATELAPALPIDSVRASLGFGARTNANKRVASRPLDVLVVEDNAVNQRLARALLESWGHRCVVADNGADALDVIEQNTLDVVLMDMQMPVMDGVEATQALRAREANKGYERLPVLAMTANSMANDVDRCIEAGMDGYVAKPIDADVLFEKLEALGQATT